MLDEIIEGIGKFVLHFILETLFFYTGEIVLYLLTLGRKKPRWDYYVNEKPSKYVIFTEASMYVGMFSWIFAICWTARTFL
jgi:hypothetical protein